MKACHVSKSESTGFAPLNYLVCVEASREEESCVGLARVTSAFQGLNEAFLSVSVGDTIHVFKEVTEFPGWADASIAGKRGLVPSVCLEPLPLENSYVPFALLLMADESLVRALGSVVKPTAAEKVGKALLDVFTHDEMRLLRICIDSEVAFTTTEGTLFRRNSINSTVLGEYGRRIGGEYLRQTVQPTLDKISFGNEGYELDPSKLGPTESLKSNTANLLARCDEFLTRLVASVDKLPRELAHACFLLSESVTAKMPGARYVGIGGFLLLRFILPVMATGLPGSVIPAERRRGLVLISKAMINLVNDVEFGKKEPFMSVLEEPLRKPGIEKIHLFLDKAVALGASFNPTSVSSFVPVALASAESQEEALGRLRIACKEGLAELTKMDAAMGKRVERAIAQCPLTALKDSALQPEEYAELEKKYPDFTGDKKLLHEKVLALGKAKDHEAALQRLVPVVNSAKEKKQVADELAQAIEETKKLEAALNHLLENNQVNLMESRF